MIFLAQSLDRFSPGVIGWAVIALASALALAALVLVVLNQGRKFFGRQPTFDEILKTLMSVDDFKIYKEEQRLRNVGIEAQISAARHAFDERANSDLKRTLETFELVFRLGSERERMISALRDTVSRLQERTETHIRQLDQLFQKFDNVLQRLPHEGRRYPKGD